MDTIEFYKLVDRQIDLLIKKFKENPYLKKQKNEDGRKSFAFLLWFLYRYSPGLSSIETYITDGQDDASCDIIFENKDNFGRKVFYVVQSKWNSESNVKGASGVTKEIKACLSDFTIIARGKKTTSTININFNKKYEELLEHISTSGETKFIFLTLAKGKHDAQDNINAFNEDYPFEIINIDRLKRDYVEMVYKGAKTHNPIETPYIPKGNIEIEFIQDNNIFIEGPYISYILLVRPKLIFELFSKYGFALFYNNIRNPLFKSNFNENIASTIKDNPFQFWYFNNGVTAISDHINKIRTGSKKVTVTGLQIINGAQTVFSIYNSYKNASPSDRAKMDSDAVISFRLLKSGGKDFDLNVTRYTNSQNPVSERDFHANDEIQIQLQNDFLDNTGIWYERRRGEFRTKHKGTSIIPNEDIGQTYLAYSLQDPLSAKGKIKLLFISETINKEGLYEKVFNNKTKYDDMLSSYLLYVYIEKRKAEVNRKIKNIEPNSDGSYNSSDQLTLQLEFILHASFHYLTFFNIVLLKKYDSKSLNGIIHTKFKNDKLEEIESIYNDITDKVKKTINITKMKDERFTYTKYFKSADSLKLKDLF
ncbi:AIPR family protein [Sediminibacterium sp. C3]|uniref:AIPR family protein n=1 Tax=Sediminibacterium sp. C3 TaxID=1267211 RepID=UPI0003FD8420|nr:AIPR family protein [Sediminibacterium sp. C3]